MTKPDVIQAMFEALESPNRELTKWEEDFIASVKEQFQTRGSLSVKQAEILERIYSGKDSMRITPPSEDTHFGSERVSNESEGIDQEEFDRIREFLSKPDWKCPVCASMNFHANKGCAYCINRSNSIHLSD